MKNELYQRVYNELNLRETDDLLEIWEKNDRVEWSDETFEIVVAILRERKVEIPQQGEPIYEHEEETKIDRDDFSEEELKIIDDENPPDFYDPFEILKLNRWIGWAIKTIIILFVISNVTDFSNYIRYARILFFRNNLDSPFVYVLAVILLIITLGIEVVVNVLLLKTAAQVLKILMEMEFNSRKAKS